MMHLDWTMVGWRPPIELIAQARSGQLRVAWLNLPESWVVLVWLVLIGLIVAGVYALYVREAQTCPRGWRVVLATLRAVVLLALLIMLLKPSVFYQQVTIVRPTITLLRDSSLSMARRDAYPEAGEADRLAALTGLSSEALRSGEVSRAELVTSALENRGGELLRNWTERGAIAVLDFADGVQAAALIPAAGTSTGGESNAGTPPSQTEAAPLNVPPLAPTGLATDLWQALRYGLDEGNRVSAIVLLSEGQHNGLNDPLEMARRAQSQGIPIFAVGTGDPTPARNISVTNLYVNRQVFPGEPFEIEAIVQATLSPDDPGRAQEVTLELLAQRVDRQGTLGSAQSLARQNVAVPEQGGRLRTSFRHTVGEPGTYVFTVQSLPIDGESDLEDNVRRTGEILVMDEKTRVLLISGLPNWDFQHLRKLLQQDASIQLSCWLQSLDETMLQEGNLPITRLPRSLDELGQYNVIIMIDPNPIEFDQSWMVALQEYCRFKAGGVIYMAGPHHTSEFITMSRLRGFLDVLPVRFGDAASIAEFQVLAEAGGSVTGGMQIVPNALMHPIMNVRGDLAENQQRWGEMPGFLWNFPTLAAKPASRVLIERGDQVGVDGNQPLLVEGRYGAGTVLYFGFQGTWRWRSVGIQAQFFDRFWIQTVRYLMENRTLQGARRGFLDLDQSEYELGKQIVVRARWLDEQFRPATSESIDVRLTDDSGRTQPLTLRLIPDQPGQYEGSLVASRVGHYQATIILPDATANDPRVESVSFRIVPPSVESNAYWLNQKLLQELAEQSGGRYFRLDQLDELASVLPQLETRAEFNSPPEPIWEFSVWTRRLLFLLLVVLLTVEWGVRKWYKLL